MSFLDRLSDSIREGVGELEKKAQELREGVNQELSMHKIRKRLQSLQNEQAETWKAMGQHLARTLTEGAAFRSEDYAEQMEYLKALSERIRNTESEINALYEDGANDTETDEVVVEKDRTED